jgi:hypothetical protein
MVASKDIYLYLALGEANRKTMKMTHFLAAILVDPSCRLELSLLVDGKVSTLT